MILESVGKIEKLGAYPISDKAYTKESITMYVDYASGISPPSGTIVTSQADYDKLGADLKYPQDAIDILPTILKGWIRIILRAGMHYAKPGNYDDTNNAALVIKGKTYDVFGKWLETVSWGNGSAQDGKIYFEGEWNTYEASQSGVTSGDTLTRDSGTWSVNELKDKYVRILTGSGAGSIRLIKSNNTTQITSVFAFAPTGACTFEIIEHGSIWLSRNPNDSVSNGLFLGSEIDFFNIQFGTIAKPMKSLNCGYNPNFSRVSFYNCNALLNGGSDLNIAVFSTSLFTWYYGLIECAGGYGIHIREYSVFASVYCMIRGYSVVNSLFKGAIEVEDNSICYIYLGFLEPYGAFTNYLIRGKNGILGLYYAVIDGLSQAKGILIDNARMELLNSFFINNTTLAIDIPVGSVFKYTYTITGTGNTVGYKLDRGARVTMDQDPSGLAATTEIDLDGVAKTYAGDLPNPGDYIVGVRGSQFHR